VAWPRVPILKRVTLAAPWWRPAGVGRMSGQGRGCATVQANPTRERNFGVLGIPVSVRQVLVHEVSVAET
jgi:hypothetical protein